MQSLRSSSSLRFLQIRSTALRGIPRQLPPSSLEFYLSSPSSFLVCPTLIRGPVGHFVQYTLPNLWSPASANIAASGKHFFTPVVYWNYMDLIVITISLAVAFYKVYYDSQVDVRDANGNLLPPIVSTVSHPEICNEASGTREKSRTPAIMPNPHVFSGSNLPSIVARSVLPNESPQRHRPRHIQRKSHLQRFVSRG